MFFSNSSITVLVENRFLLSTTWLLLLLLLLLLLWWLRRSVLVRGAPSITPVGVRRIKSIRTPGLLVLLAGVSALLLWSCAEPDTANRGAPLPNPTDGEDCPRLCLTAECAVVGCSCGPVRGSCVSPSTILPSSSHSRNTSCNKQIAAMKQYYTRQYCVCTVHTHSFIHTYTLYIHTSIHYTYN